jgi:hypothetical protein
MQRSARRQTVRARCADGGGTGTTGQDEILERREVGVELFDQIFQSVDMRRR